MGVSWEFAAQCVLRYCKQFSPNFWSSDKFPALTTAWAAAFARANIDLDYLMRGVTRWYEKDTTGGRPTPGQIIAEAKAERQAYERTPEGLKKAEERYIQMEEERDRLLAEGRFTFRG